MAGEQAEGFDIEGKTVGSVIQPQFQITLCGKVVIGGIDFSDGEVLAVIPQAFCRCLHINVEAAFNQAPVRPC